MKNEVYLDFRIVGFEDILPDDISKITGITPSRIVTKGDKRNPRKAESTAIHKNSIWILASPLGEYATFEDQMNALLDILEAHLDSLIPLCEKYYSEFSCRVFIYMSNEESTPWIHLNKRYNQLVAKLNTEFDVDLYCLPGEEEEQ